MSIFGLLHFLEFRYSLKRSPRVRIFIPLRIQYFMASACVCAVCVCAFVRVCACPLRQVGPSRPLRIDHFPRPLPHLHVCMKVWPDPAGSLAQGGWSTRGSRRATLELHRRLASLSWLPWHARGLQGLSFFKASCTSPFIWFKQCGPAPRHEQAVLARRPPRWWHGPLLKPILEIMQWSTTMRPPGHIQEALVFRRGSRIRRPSTSSTTSSTRPRRSTLASRQTDQDRVPHPLTPNPHPLKHQPYPKPLHPKP